MYFCNLIIIFAWKRAGSLIWTGLHPFDPSLLEIDQVVLERKIFQIWQRIFTILNYLPSEKEGPFIWTNSNLLHPRMICAKLDWNLPSDSEEEDFLNFVIVISQFRNFLPLEKGGPFIWTNLTSLHTKDDLC